MKTVPIILLLLFAGILCIYLAVRTTWQKIDIISGRAENYIKIHSDPGFDAEKFRASADSLLGSLHFTAGYRIIFHAPFYEKSSRQMALNAHTGLPGLGIIILSPGWAAKLYRTFEGKRSGADRVGTMDFFSFVIGHEISHKEQRMKPIFLFGKKRKCADWIREIDADFGGLKKAGVSHRRIAEWVRKEILSKRKHTGSVRKTGASPFSHPTWEYRIKCWELGRFDESVIDRICLDCGVDDLRFRNKMKRYYL